MIILELTIFRCPQKKEQENKRNNKTDNQHQIDNPHNYKYIITIVQSNPEIILIYMMHVRVKPDLYHVFYKA